MRLFRSLSVVKLHRYTSVAIFVMFFRIKAWFTLIAIMVEVDQVVLSLFGRIADQLSLVSMLLNTEENLRLVSFGKLTLLVKET
jgi:hypothetical protein